MDTKGKISFGVMSSANEKPYPSQGMSANSMKQYSMLVTEQAAGE